MVAPVKKRPAGERLYRLIAIVEACFTILAIIAQRAQALAREGSILIWAIVALADIRRSKAGWWMCLFRVCATRAAFSTGAEPHPATRCQPERSEWFSR